MHHPDSLGRGFYIGIIAFAKYIYPKNMVNATAAIQKSSKSVCTKMTLIFVAGDQLLIVGIFCYDEKSHPILAWAVQHRIDDDFRQRIIFTGVIGAFIFFYKLSDSVFQNGRVLPVYFLRDPDLIPIFFFI